MKIQLDTTLTCWKSQFQFSILSALEIEMFLQFPCDLFVRMEYAKFSHFEMFAWNSAMV